MNMLLFWILIVVAMTCAALFFQFWKACRQMGKCSRRDWTQTFAPLIVSVVLVFVAFKYVL